MHKVQVYITSAVVLSLCAASIADAKRIKAPPPAPRCWKVPEITAAKINELSILLNVQSLRCRNVDKTIQDQYDSFTRASGSTMKDVSGIVRGHFGGSDSLYDRYAISLANKYGAGVAGQSCPMVATLMQSAISGGGSAAALSQVAETANVDPTLLGGPCPLRPLAPFAAVPVKAPVKTKTRRHK